MPERDSIRLNPIFHSKHCPRMALDANTDTRRIIDALSRHSGLSMADMARILQVQHTSISQYREGKRNNPRMRWLLRLLALNNARLVIEFPREPFGPTRSRPEERGRRGGGIPNVEAKTAY